MKNWFFPICVLMAAALALASCATPGFTPTAPSTGSPTAPESTSATPLPTSPAATPAAVTPEPPTITPVPPSPTPAPPRVTLATADGEQADALQEAIQRAAQEFGWQTEFLKAPAPAALRAAAESSAIMVVNGPALEEQARALAGGFPSVYFICPHLNGGDLPSNLLALGGAARGDQAGFMAGMAAGFVTQTKRVAVIGDPASAEGLQYRNGFLHGVRYTCPRCRVDNIDVLDPGDVTGAADTAAKYKRYGVDVFFTAAGEAGNAALATVTKAGAWGIGSGSDVYLTLFSGGAAPGADKLLTSVYLDSASAVYMALAGYAKGAPPKGDQSLSAANQAVTLAPYRDQTGALSPLDQQALADALERLGLGSLDTGIDPLTGEER
jgi:basic membrane protein A